jgi:hypothetical protein
MLYYQSVEYRTKPDVALKMLNSERLTDMADETYNADSNTAYLKTRGLCFVYFFNIFYPFLVISIFY